MIRKIKIFNTIDTLRNRPKLFLEEPNYKSLSLFIYGYLTALHDFYDVNYNIEFSKWVQKKHGHSNSVIWGNYIYEKLAQKNETLALDILLSDLIEFLNSRTEFQKDL